MGDVDYPASIYHGEGYKVHFWGGRDVRERWPLFARGLGDVVVSSQEIEMELDESLEMSDDDLYESSQEDTDTDGSDQAQVSDFSSNSDREDVVDVENENISKPQSSVSVSVDRDGVYLIRSSEGGKLVDDTDGSDELQTSDLAESPDLSDCGDDFAEAGSEVNENLEENGDKPSGINDDKKGTNALSSFESEKSVNEFDNDDSEEVENSEKEHENDVLEDETRVHEYNELNDVIDKKVEKSETALENDEVE